MIRTQTQVCDILWKRAMDQRATTTFLSMQTELCELRLA